MRDQTKNTLIGLFILAAIAIVIYILLFLHPNVGDEGQVIRVRFTNIDKISVGTRVLFAGHPIGEVSHIEEVADARDPSHVIDGHVYIYELVLQIDSGIIIYTTDELTGSTSGLLGEKSIAISPRPAPKGKTLVRVTDQILYASPVYGVEDALKSFDNLSNKAQEALETINHQLSVLVDGKFFDNLASTATNLKEMTASGKTLLADVKEGKGTLGQLISQDDLYLQLTSLLSKGETLMDDINHFGLLFQNNATWQRLRARRINIMAKLETPQEFRNFFNDEIDQISTSLSRVSMVLNDSESCCDYWMNLCSPEFTTMFAELLRRTDELNKNLQLVDQQVVDKKKQCSCR